jgi:hypothetical protein
VRKVTGRVLTLRELNRATLARQLLLERAALPVPAAVERLVGLQAQAQLPPYVGLWTRLNDFSRDSLAHLIEDHTIVKVTFIRATLHVITAEDYVRLRGTIQPVLEGASESIAKQRGAAFDLDKILRTARDYFAEQPRSFAEITARFEELMPDVDVSAIRYTIRTHLPLVVVPNDSRWSYPGNPKFTLAEAWLGKPVPTENDFRGLVLRYLAAFGPAGVTDIQTWSGLGKLKAAVEALKPELVTYNDEHGRELYDLPDTLLPAADVPAPIRFLPEYDNLLLSHSNRTRVLADEFRSKVYLPGLRVAATFLVDGFVAGVWKVEKTKGTATLSIEALTPLEKQHQAALADEAERLVRFIEADAKAYEVKFTGQ